MEGYQGPPADLHLSNDVSAVCFFKSFSSVSSMSDILLDSQPLRENAPQMPKFSDGFPQKSIRKENQNSPRETCLFTNQNFRSRTAPAQVTIPSSMESWNYSLASVNSEKSVSDKKITNVHSAVDFAHRTLNSEHNHAYKRINELQLLRRIWRAWSKFTSHQRALREGCAHIKAVRERSLKLEAFEQWRRRSWQLPRARLIAFNFEQSQNAALLRQVFSDWRHLAEEARAQRLERQIILDNASRRIAKMSKALYFRCWQEALDTQKKHTVAAKASERRILLKTFNCWRVWTAELIHRDCLQKQAKCFLETRLKISFFTRWIDAQREHRRIRMLEKIALSHCALAMEARVWIAWRLFLKNRQTEQARRRAAYQRYLSRMAKQALTLWLTSAFNMQKGRLSQTKSCTTHQNSIAMKFYQIWIGALPLKQKCGNYSLDLQGFHLCPSEDGGGADNYEAGEEDYFLGSLNIGLNYHELQPRIPQCIMASYNERILSRTSSLTAENLRLESGKHIATEQETHPDACPDKKLKCQLLALEVAETKERDPMLKMQIKEEIGQGESFMIVRRSAVSGYQTTKEMIAYSFPRTVDGLKPEPYGENGFGGFPVSREPHTSGDLVSLSWLQKGNILQITPLDSEEDVTREVRLSTAASVKEETITSGYTVCPSHITVASNGSTLPTRLSLSSAGSQVLTSSYVGSSAFSNPYSQGLGKPCYSYTHLIFMAIESTPQKCMTVNQIYNWCEANFPFYKHAGAGWKNSLRHNLSINKSFKRLPRDGRAGNFANYMTCNMALLCDSSFICDEGDEADEGPGRGAYWAVEPRERQNLLGAVKRNPWSVNFNRERSVIRQLPCNAITDSGAVIGNSPFSRSDGTSQLPGLNLSQNATEAVLRSSGIGMCNLTLPSNRSSTNSFALLDSNTGAKNDPEILNHTTHDCSRGILQTSDASSNIISVGTADGICFTSPSPRSNSLVIEQPKELSDPSWSIEEEEKYQSMLRLLLESTDDVVTSKSPSACSKAGSSDNVVYSPRLPPKDGNRYGGPVPTKKEGTKQRRKSCLYPTNEGMCNECKENKAPNCRSCQLRMLQSQGVSSSRSTLGLLSKLKLLNCSLTDGALEELIDVLDSDQEQGPAGGPAVRRTAVKPEETAGAHSGDQGPANRGSSSESGEVFITPAPHLDHEYAHCQKQLRRPEDSRVVELYNSRYRKSRLQFLRSLAENRLSHSTSRHSMHHLSSSHNIHNEFGIGGEEPDDSENSVSMLEETPQGSSDYDSDVTPEIAMTYKNGTLDYTRFHCERLRTQTLRHADAIEDYDSVTIDRPVRRKRGRPGLKGKVSSRNSNRSIRRSSRAVRPPKRPYDDDDGLGEAEDFDSMADLTSPRLCVDEGDYEKLTSNSHSYHSRMHPFGRPYRRRSRLVPRLIPSTFSTSTFEETNCSETKILVDSQTYPEKRRSSRWPGPTSPSTGGESTDEFTAMDSDGDFVNQPLRHKVRRLSKQSVGSVESRNDLHFIRRQPGRPPSTVTHETSKLKVRRKEASQAFSIGSVNSSHGQRREVATAIEEGLDVGGKDGPMKTATSVDNVSVDRESVEEEGSDKSFTGTLNRVSQEQTTVEAAQILVGIGKMQDLDRNTDNSDECGVSHS